MMRIPTCPSLAPCSPPSRPLRAASGGGLRPVLTAAARGATLTAGRDEETVPPVEQRNCTRCRTFLQNSPHTTHKPIRARSACGMPIRHREPDEPGQGQCPSLIPEGGQRLPVAGVGVKFPRHARGIMLPPIGQQRSNGGRTVALRRGLFGFPFPPQCLGSQRVG